MTGEVKVPTKSQLSGNKIVELDATLGEEVEKFLKLAAAGVVVVAFRE